MTDFATEPDFDPYAGDARSGVLPSLLPVQEQTLELVAHLAAYSDMLVVVSGPDGSGKTLLAETLAERRHAADDALLLTANNMLGMPALLQRIAAHWQIQLPQELPAARELISREAQQRAEQGGHLLLVIDQAEQLDSETLNDIAHFALLVPQALSIVLFGQTGFEQALRGGPAQAQVQVQPLAPLNAADAQQLLQRVYSPGQALPLSQNELTFIWQQSQGWPGPLLMQAGDYFLAAQPDDAPTAVTRKEKTASGGFPVTHILAVTALVAALGLSLLYRDDKPAEAPLTDETVAEPVDFLRGSSPLAEPEISTQIAEPQEPERLADVLPEMIPAPSAPEQVSRPQAAAEPDYNYGPATLAEPVSAPPVVAVPPVPAPAAAVPAAPKTTVAAPATAKATPVADDRQRLLAVRSGFVVQLFGSYESVNADKFRRQWRDDIVGTLYLYETRHNSKPWFVVVSGVYGSRPEAEAAVNALPRPLRSQSPWIRDITSVQNALR